MLTAALDMFWPVSAPAQARPAAPRRTRGPVFIGDAVQPWGAETLLLAILRADARRIGAKDDGDD